MALEAENIYFESMGFGPYAIQDCFMGSVFGFNEDSFCFQELDQRRCELQPFVDYSYDNLIASSSSSSLFSCGGSLPVEIVQSLSTEFEKQRVEMDWFLQLELTEQEIEKVNLGRGNAAKKAVMMQKYESRIKTLMLQKDEELAMARNRTRELQQFLKGAEMEAKAWEKTAKEKEAIVSDLNKRLNQVKEKESLFREDDDAVSFCDSSSKGEGNNNSKKMNCKLCQFRSSCVVFFPCKHLCCCKNCDTLLGHCPVCETVKEASLEVFWG